ncbi:hypothetical protein GQ457_11G028040 [Hibiscus cannabinus]
MTFQDPWYRYPKAGIDTQGTDTLREVSIPSLLFFKMQIPVSILGTDTQREYRYPRAGTDTLRLGTDTLVQNLQRIAGKTPPTAPNKVQRSPTARITFGTIKQASKHQGKTNASLYNIIMIKNCLSA